MICLAASVAAIHLFSAVFLDTRLQYTEETYRSHAVPESLDGYTIVLLTDIHGYPPRKLRAMVERINQRGVDLVAIGGDFSHQKDLDECFAILAEIQAADGFYGVEGNHDNADTLRAAMSGAGITLLENSSFRVRDGLYVAGVEDLWNRDPDVDKALESAKAEDFTLLLAHNPDVAMDRDVGGADLILSGHTHGGEATFFGVWAPAMGFVSRYGQRFRSGWCKSAADTDVYVSRGIGNSIYIRCFSRPQVVYFTFKTAGETAAKAAEKRTLQ